MQFGDDKAKSLRGKTDQSLEEERHKTDEYLGQKNQNVTNEADNAIRVDRLAADEKRENVRADVDSDRAEVRLHSHASESSLLDDNNLIAERNRSDVAQKIERAKEDRIRIKERFQKRLIAEALLENERNETDTNLIDERTRLDRESAQNAEWLFDEKSSHELTKAALVTRDQFLAVVSHDLKNPLGSITMSGALMRSELSKRTGDFTNELKYLEIIERNAANMDRMITDLLDVERMTNSKLVLKKEETDIGALLGECKALFGPVVANKSFSMTIQVPSEPIFASVDHDRVLQVLSNLVGNALKFGSNGVEIDLSVSRKANEVEVCVKDNGPGIPTQKLSKVFERFSQLGDSDRRGLGLGLFISKWIVEAHNGRIWASSVAGAGSTFSFTLPVLSSD